MTCKKCGNKLGFVMGTCVQCGFNEIDNTYRHITVYVEDLPVDLRYELIKEHNKRVTYN